MKLFNVYVNHSYTTSGYYSQEIDLSYTTLVVANNQNEAKEFIQNIVDSNNECMDHEDSKEAIEELVEIDFDKIKRLRKVQLYKK